MSACGPKKTVKSGSDDILSDLPMKDKRGKGRRGKGGPLGDDDITNFERDEMRIRGKQFSESPDLTDIHFNYDMYSLSNAARMILRENASYLKDNPGLEILVEGHCDDRGTSEYNLALGQQRANAVRNYYIQLGLDRKSIGTISFGEEAPSCSEETDECWHFNRRSMTKIRSQISSNSVIDYQD